MLNSICPFCNSGHLVSVLGTYESHYKDSEGELRPLYVPNMNWYRCDRCEEELLENSAMREIEESRRIAMGLLSSADLKRLREKHGKSQEGMAELLGAGKKSYCRWESGAVQSEAFDRFLRLLIEEPNNIVLLEEIAERKAAAFYTLEAMEEATIEFAYIRNESYLDQFGKMFSEALGDGQLLTV